MAPAESAEQIVAYPPGTHYCIADAPVLWFWAHGRSGAARNPQAFVDARQALLERDVLRDKLHDADSADAPARPS